MIQPHRALSAKTVLVAVGRSVAREKPATNGLRHQTTEAEVVGWRLRFGRKRDLGRFSCGHRVVRSGVKYALRTMMTEGAMIRKLPDGRYRLYSMKKDPKTGKRRNLGTFRTRAAAEKHERAVQFFKRAGG